MDNQNFSRRDFLKGPLAFGITGALGGGLIASCTSGTDLSNLYDYPKRQLTLPPLLDAAPRSEERRVG